MSKTIYLVTAGQYHYYHVKCAFTRKVDADRFIDTLDKSDLHNRDVNVEECELDQL